MSGSYDLMTDFWFRKQSINLIIFPQNKFPIRYENSVILPDSSGFDVQAYITR